jgi:hypothetical protein
MSINSNNNLLNEILSTIDGLPMSKEEQEKSITIVENGTTEVTSDEGKALSKVTVNVEVEQSNGEDILEAYLSYTLTQVRCENITAFTTTHKFADQINLISADFPNLTRTHDYVFSGCTSLVNVNLPKATYVGLRAFDNCKNLEYISFPSATIVYGSAFLNAIKLKTVDFGTTVNFARTDSFNGCSSLDTLVLRGNEVSPLSNIALFTSVGAFSADATGGTIYVPGALIESYKEATNWSALYEAGRCNFVAIEGSEYE